jgi:hypothetical protein
MNQTEKYYILKNFISFVFKGGGQLFIDWITQLEGGGGEFNGHGNTW